MSHRGARGAALLALAAVVAAATPARGERLRHTGLPPAIAGRDVTRTVPAVDLGEVRSGTIGCGTTGLDPSVTYEETPLGRLPASVQVGVERPAGVLWPPAAMSASRVCVRADLWAPSMPPREVLLVARDRDGPSRGGRVTVPVRFSVRRAPRVGHVATLAWFPIAFVLIGLAVRLRQPRFDRGEALAWVVDVPGGYRDSAARHLAVTPLLELMATSGARSRLRGGLPLHEMLTSDAPLPRVVLEPVAGGGVHVRSEVPLVIRREADVAPSTAGPSATVPYGAVVRAGPLVFALLLRDQRALLDSGRLSLELPAESELGARPTEAARAGSTTTRDSHPAVAVLGWSLLLALALGAGLAVALWGPATDGPTVAGQSAVVMAAVAGAGALVARIVSHASREGE